MNRLTRVFLRVVSLAWARQGRDRYREELEADLQGAPELGLSRASVALGQLRTAASVIFQGELVPHPIGPLAIALRHTGAKRGPVLMLVLVLGSALLIGVGLLLIR